LKRGNDDGSGRLTHSKCVRSHEQRILYFRHRRNANPDNAGSSRLRFQSRLRKERRRNIDDDQNVGLRFQLSKKHLRLPLRIECCRPGYPDFDPAIEVLGRGVGSSQNFGAPFAGCQS
jgi:hypothetical protein